jgi:hypothetical protein
MLVTEEIVNMFGRLMEKRGGLQGTGKHQIVALNHFKDFYKEQRGSSTIDQVRVVALFPRMMDDTEAEALYQACEKEELKKVLKFF